MHLKSPLFLGNRTANPKTRAIIDYCFKILDPILLGRLILSF